MIFKRGSSWIADYHQEELEVNFAGRRCQSCFDVQPYLKQDGPTSMSHGDGLKPSVRKAWNMGVIDSSQQMMINGWRKWMWIYIPFFCTNGYPAGNGMFTFLFQTTSLIDSPWFKTCFKTPRLVLDYCTGSQWAVSSWLPWQLWRFPNPSPFRTCTALATGNHAFKCI